MSRVPPGDAAASGQAAVDARSLRDDLRGYVVEHLGEPAAVGA